MMPVNHGPSENLTLSLAELEAYQGQGAGQRAGKHLRYFCPIHGGDNQRSLSLDPESGRFQCFACEAWGYLAEKREAWMEERRREGAWKPTGGRSEPGHGLRRPQEAIRVVPQGEDGPKARADLHAFLAEFQKALPGSWGAEYLHRRGIPLEVAQTYGVGYVAAGKWPNPKRDWKWGRLVFPHTTPDGEIVNIYGRAVGSNEKVSKDKRHDHLPGAKGVFNARALSDGTVFICEGVFDALSLVAAGHAEHEVRDVCAIFGLNGLRWRWVKAKEIIFAFDQDTGGDKWKELAWQGKLLGKEVYFLPPEAYGQHTDLNEAWVATGTLDIGGWNF